MFGNQLKRVKKRAKYLKEQTAVNEQYKKDLKQRLQMEQCVFLETCSNAKLVLVSGEKMKVFLDHRTKVVFRLNHSYADVFVDGAEVACYFRDRQGFSNSYHELTNDIKSKVSPLLQLLLPAWEEAVATRDYESFECSRTLRWIAKEIPGNTQWPDIISGNFPLK